MSNNIKPSKYPVNPDEQAEIINETQAHVITDKGIILIDVTENVDGQQLTTIQDLLSYLYK